MRLKVLLALAICFIITLSALLFRAQEQLRAGAAIVEQALAEKRQIQADLEAAQAKALSDAELNRLKEDQRDAIKLRGEVVNLKNAVAAAEKAKAATQKAASSKPAAPVAKVSPDENPYARIVSRTANAILPLGHGLALGDFESSPGKHTFAVAIPTKDPTNPSNILIETKFVEFGADAKPELRSLLPPSGANSILTADQLNAFLASLQNEAGVDILGAPRVSTSSGTSASVSIIENRDTPNGPIAVGPVVNITPVLSADGASVNLAIDAKLTLPKDSNAP